MDRRVDLNVNARNRCHVDNRWKKAKTPLTRVATAQGKQGKQGIWFLLFPDRENTGNFALTQGKILRHRENIFL